MNYCDFIALKQRASELFGFDFSIEEINANAFPWQKAIIQWAIRRGRAAIFADTGLGKTIMQLEWARIVHDKTGKPVIVHMPLGVRGQAFREGQKFNIASPFFAPNQQSEIGYGINLVNYEKLHKFDTSIFGGVVLDEASILKNYVGETKKMLCESYSRTPYRLACTATPAPNDHMELGNQADFLGIMPSNEMLSRWFINDTMHAGGYRLKHHGRDDFWQWVCTWGACVSKPSDVGGSDSGYDLPPLELIEHYVDIDSNAVVPEGFLFRTGRVSATTIHDEKRSTVNNRSAKAIEIAKGTTGPVIIWCDTDYEADVLTRLMPEAVEVRGSLPEKQKEERLAAFTKGDIRVIITKPQIAGFGLNWQHCNTQVFAGLSFSYELFYQAVRRSWRFGQNRQVDVHIVIAQTESAIKSIQDIKKVKHHEMQEAMRQAMQKSGIAVTNAGIIRRKYKKINFKAPNLLKVIND